MWQLTIHAMEQMAQRGISKAEVLGALADPDHKFVVSERDESLGLLTGKAGERFLTVLIDEADKRVVTVRAASRKERRKYGEQTNNVRDSR